MPEPIEPTLPAIWEITEEGTTVAVDGSTILDSIEGAELAAVVVRMPAFAVENLVRALLGWSAVANIAREALDETHLANLLAAAARAARNLDGDSQGTDTGS
jgi:hypothetical protein